MGVCLCMCMCVCMKCMHMYICVCIYVWSVCVCVCVCVRVYIYLLVCFLMHCGDGQGNMGVSVPIAHPTVVVALSVFFHRFGGCYAPLHPMCYFNILPCWFLHCHRVVVRLTAFHCFFLFRSFCFSVILRSYLRIYVCVCRLRSLRNSSTKNDE